MITSRNILYLAAQTHKQNDRRQFDFTCIWDLLCRLRAKGGQKCRLERRLERRW